MTGKYSTYVLYIQSLNFTQTHKPLLTYLLAYTHTHTHTHTHSLTFHLHPLPHPHSHYFLREGVATRELARLYRDNGQGSKAAECYYHHLLLTGGEGLVAAVQKVVQGINYLFLNRCMSIILFFMLMISVLVLIFIAI